LTCSGEDNCQQAGTEQNQAAYGECEETVGREIIVAHDVPPLGEAVRNLLKMSQWAAMLWWLASQ
jgi:hypothetical protein